MLTLSFVDPDPKRLFVACNNSARVGANTCGLDGVHSDTLTPIATDHCGCGPIPPLRSRRARRSLTHLPSALSSNA